MTSTPVRPDIVVIGASAGGVSALQRLVQALPGDLAATVLIVLHVPAESKSMLGPVLARASALPVSTPVDGEPMKQSHIYVAPPDQDRVRVTHGPLQNRHRPSIDVLFRSAATGYGTRVIGVVLTGFLSDGTVGLQSIKDLGGTSIVQDPATALIPSMPESALRNVKVDFVVPLEEIPLLIAQLTSRPSPTRAINQDSAHVHRLEAAADLGQVIDLEKVARPSSYICPDCVGGLWELRGGATRFRCGVGHGYSLDDLTKSQDEQVETALWAAARSLEDRAVLSRRLADQWRDRDAEDVVEHFQRRGEESARHAAVLRGLLGVPADDAAP
jgi:two-component system, chemotaxis family, protein-glutamate methylesterase/glutaminase